MQKYPEVSIENAKEAYHGKSAVVFVENGKRTVQYKAIIFVGPGWIRINAIVGHEKGGTLTRPIPITQEIAESIRPVGPRDLLAWRVDFVVQKPLPPLPPE